MAAGSGWGLDRPAGELDVVLFLTGVPLEPLGDPDAAVSFVGPAAVSADGGERHGRSPRRVGRGMGRGVIVGVERPPDPVAP